MKLKIKFASSNNTDQLICVRYLLEESDFTIILHNDTSGIKYVGFLTFFDSLKNNNEIIIDATCKNKHDVLLFFTLLALYYNVFFTLTCNYNCR